jgi:hypothetical protein
LQDEIKFDLLNIGIPQKYKLPDNPGKSTIGLRFGVVYKSDGAKLDFVACHHSKKTFTFKPTMCTKTKSFHKYITLHDTTKKANTFFKTHHINQPE